MPTKNIRIKSTSSIKLIGKSKKQVSSEVLRTEIDVDEFHTREVVDKQTKKGKENQLETKETWMDCFVPNLRITFIGALETTFNIPELESMEKVEAIREMGNLFDVSDYENNLISYWILEILVEALKQSQKNEMLAESQKVSIVWITFILKEITLYGLKRREMFKYLEMLFHKADKVIGSGGPIPNPYDLAESASEESKTKKDGKNTPSSRTVKSTTKSKMKSEAESMMYSFKAESLKYKREKDFYLLINQIYSIFANRFKYEIIKETFSSFNIIETITISDRIEKSKEPPNGGSNLKHEVSPQRIATKLNLGHSRRRSPPKSKPKKDVTLHGSFIKKDVKKDFVLKMLKEIYEPTKLEDEIQTGKVIYPYLLPLNQAVQPGFFDQSTWQRETAQTSHKSYLHAEPSQHARRYSF